jgi:hypothetical protein
VAARASDDVLAQRIDDLRDELRAGFAELREDMRTGFGDTRASIAEVREDMRTGFGDIRASFADVRADIRALHTRVDTLLLAVVVGLFGVAATLLVKL